ncbi:sugar phosphate isomerase/epimerase [Oceanobacillus sp. Castelsardo]|uniref:sugar phosphate isomerase/epimerase family protein n=1 Tax=Oceanobacillus sp. Castelsardo TaxID=1851204 RepID=UPI000839A06F|nr:sugar phosphate isomerase/epimerase [Oceanobacillus sp. Castelsardo]
MKLAYNVATTKENATLEQDLEFCEKHGFDYVEIQMWKLPAYLEKHTLDDLAEFFRTNHLKLLSLNALEFFNNRSKEDEEQIIQTFKEWLEIGKKLGAQYIVAVPNITEEKFLHKDIKDSCVELLREFSDLARPYGIKVAFEFIGHPQATVNTFKQGYEIVQEVNRDNVGLVLDCFHFHGMGSRLVDLKQADGSKIFLLHIDDADDYPIGIVRDEDRCWPGHGVIDLDGIFSTLKEIGFHGEVCSIELFRPEYYKMNPEEVIKSSKETMVDVISKHYEIEEPINQ